MATDQEQQQPHGSSLAWYRQSYPCVLVSLFFLNQHAPILFLVAFVLGVINAKNENWYRHIWPWLLLIPLVVVTFVNFVGLRIAATHPDPLVPIETKRSIDGQ
jgi:phosphoglycerol transferase MdoB-like AlkP superfamily enzyme